MRNIRAWFGVFWPRRARAVAEDYVVIGRDHQLFLADIALRGNLFSRLEPPPADLWQAGRAEGRREMALEIFKMCRADPAQLYALIEKPAERTKGAPS